ncbi:MAG: hypothetical protein N4A74_02035 [Carboxylicivirga sp.]|nr:hypothetical protein [Carboxylicivirga sp.]
MRFDFDKLIQADTIARDMAALSGKANDHMYGGNEQKLTRDKVYSLLHDVARETPKYRQFDFLITAFAAANALLK